MRAPNLALPEIITAKLRGFDRRRCWIASARGIAETLLGFGLGLLAIGLIEWLVKPALPGRILLSFGLYLLGGAIFWSRAVRPWIRRVPWRDLARDFESATQHRFRERILSAVELADSDVGSSHGISAWMASQTIRLAAVEIGPLNPPDYVNPRPAWKAWQRTILFWLPLTLSLWLPGFGSVIWLALNPRASTAMWSRTVLTVMPGDCQIVQGASLEIRARTTPSAAQARATIRWNDGFQETALMPLEGTNGFGLRLPSVTRSFAYSIQAGDAESARFTVQVLTPPALARLRVHIEPPAYALETNRVVEGGSADFLAGSRLRLDLETAGETIAHADWLPEQAAPRSFEIQTNRLVLQCQPTNIITYRVRLIGVNQLQMQPAQKWRWRPLTDTPPQAQLTALGLEAGLVQRDEVLPLVAEAGDEVGLRKVELLVLGKDALVESRMLHPPASDGSASLPVAQLKHLKLPFHYALTNLESAVGDELQFQLTATDLMGQITRSDPLTISIGARDKVLEARAVARLKPLLAALDSQMDYLKQTRSSWLSWGRNYHAEDPTANSPALTVLKGRLDEFSAALETAGHQLVSESETNGLAEARFLYRLGSTLATWGPQQREIMLDNCRHLEQGRNTNVNDGITLGRELFNRALLDLAHYRRALAVYTGALETDVLATQCESAQGRYQRALAVLRGDEDKSTTVAAILAALKDRVRAGLSLPATVPLVVSPLTNEVRNENLARLVREKLPASEALAQRLAPTSAWESLDLPLSETQANDLVGSAREARRILKEEFEQYRWRYEGAAALKEIQIALNELRDTVQDLRLLPYHSRTNLTEAEQAKMSLAKAWTKALEKAAARANHHFFEAAKQKEATLAGRNAALRAAEKAHKELRPAITKLEKQLDELLPKGKLMLQMDRRLDEVSDRYRELNELQEKMNREHIAAEARLAYPEARAFALAQWSTNAPDLTTPYLALQNAVAAVQKAQWIVGDYRGAEKLATLKGQSPAEAKGKELLNEIRGLASSTDNNPSTNPEAIAAQLEALSALAQQAAGDAKQRPSLTQQLDAMAGLTTPLADWTESNDPQETAASAAHESVQEIRAAPKQWESYNHASHILADAARQVRMEAATLPLSALNPFPEPEPKPGMAKLPARSPLSSSGSASLAGQVPRLPVPAGRDQAEWARLSARLRQAIRASGIENFSEEQQALIHAYFERLSSEP